jgi:malate dehydrogenase (oxaloacetate-decarboxylating)(NADP+)
MLDVGTNNTGYLEDPMYLGINQRRATGEEYFEIVDEFIEGVTSVFPEALIQFEDFLTPNAYSLLQKYRDRVLCFNDDIQGTAGVALAGVYASTRISGLQFSDLRIMFLGAGSAATGIADLISYALQKEGLSERQSCDRLWFVDVNGLVVKGSPGQMPHNQPYIKDHESLGFIEAIRAVRPHILIGATGSPNTFTREVIEAMTQVNERPTIFALSNPTSRAECTAEQAYTWSQGKAIFASGSPFGPVHLQGQTYTPGQGNNVYIFPGIGLGSIICRSRTITDEMFLLAARCLADQVSVGDLQHGTIYPPLTSIREVSVKIAMAVATYAWDQGLAQAPRPDDLELTIRDYMYDPKY